MQKNYLTKELIDYIQKSAKDPIWRLSGLLAALPKNWFDILLVSPLGLIHFKGNSDTGWQHINERHGYYSDENYFGEGAKGDPSKFTSKSMPIQDYVKIADEIFNSGEKDTKDHPDSDTFEKIKGQSNNYIGSKGTLKKFNLILYKGTKIVHSIYPEKHLEENRPKRILRDLSRCKGKIEIKTKLVDEWVTITVPYENSNGIIRYVIIRISEKTMIGKIYIQVNNLEGDPRHTTYPEISEFKITSKFSLRSNNLEFTRFINGLAHADFSEIEKIMGKIESFIQAKIKDENNKPYTWLW